MALCQGWIAPADAGWGVEDLEDAEEDDEDGGWGVSAVETLPSLPTAKQPETEEKQEQKVSFSLDGLRDKAAASLRQSAVAQGQALTLFQRRLQELTLTPAPGSNPNSPFGPTSAHLLPLILSILHLRHSLKEMLEWAASFMKYLSFR